MVAAVLLALISAALLGAVVPYADLYLQGSRIAYSHLPIGATVVLLFLVYVLGPTARLVGLRLSRQAVVLVFAVLLAVSALASSGYVAYLFPVTAAPWQFSTPENKWQELFGRFIPEWFVPHDRRALAAFYDGLPPGSPIPWQAWAAPLLSWTVFAVLLIAAVGALSAAVRRQWADHEKLVFPLVRVPLSLVDAAPWLAARGSRSSSQAALRAAQAAAGAVGFTRAGRWLLLAGAAAVFAFHSINALHLYFPQVPEIRVHNIPIGAALKGRPWGALAGEKIYILPSVIGVSYLLTTEVAFSFWFFHWFWAFQRLVMAAVGYEGAGGTSIPASLYGRYEEVGAFFVVAWLAVAPIIAHARQDRHIRNALFVFAAAVAGMALWLTAAGMTLTWALGFLVMYFVVSIVLARAVAAAGVLFVECSFLPQDVLVRGFGYKAVGARNLTVLAFPEMIFMFEQQTILMPYLLQAWQIGEAEGLPRPVVYGAVAAAVAVILPAAYAGALHTIYGHGALSLNDWYMIKGATWPFRRLQSTIIGEVGRDWAAIVCAAFGASLMGALTWLQRHFLWWPIHPLGYVMGSTYTMGIMWFSIFTGWAIKRVTEKYGGFKAYRAARPLFIGFVVGEFLAAAFWLVVDGLAGVKGHNIFPAF